MPGPGRKFVKHFEGHVGQANVVVEEAADGAISFFVHSTEDVRYCPYHTYQAGQDYQVHLMPVKRESL